MKKAVFYIMTAAAMLCTACTGDDAQYDASGVFETTEVIVSAKGTGELVSFHVDEGQNVSMGQELGRIDTHQLYLKKEATPLQHLCHREQATQREPTGSLHPAANLQSAT